jgi:hypothetical protein
MAWQDPTTLIFIEALRHDVPCLVSQVPVFQERPARFAFDDVWNRDRMAASRRGFGET